MKRCPECRRDYYDDTLLYCLDDGSTLLEGPASVGAAATVVLPDPLGAATGGAGEAVTRAFDARAVPPPASVAVLPFENISADADNEYFCDGLAEELLNALARIDGLKVAARTSAFSFKGRKVEMGQIAKVLNVSTVLDGSVRKSGDHLRITVRLTNASDGYQLWSERYDREIQDIFAVQDDITVAVVETLKGKLLGEICHTKKPENLAAYEAYLKGKYHLAKLTPPDLQKSIECYRQATEIDPAYAKAFVGLADAYLRTSIVAELPSKQFFPKAKAAAQKAIELDDQSAEAHALMAWIAFWYDWDWRECEQYCRRALELDPSSSDAHTAYAHLLSNTGRHVEAIAEIERAKELDPLSLFVGTMAGQFLLHAGNTEGALAAVMKILELESNFWLPHLIAASAYIEIGASDKALLEARQARQLSGGSSQAAAFEAFALVLGGKRAEADELLREVVALSGTRYVPPYHFALIHKALGDVDAAFEHLERGIDERDVKMVFLFVEPKWNDLRDDSQFRSLLEQVGFSPDAGHIVTNAL